MLFAVIPALDEAGSIADAIRDVRKEVDGIVVSDGGSIDDTAKIAREAGALVIEAPPGRGQQLQAGAEAAIQAGAEALVFLHADSALTEGSGSAIRTALRDGAVGGGFLVHFRKAPALLRWGTRLVNWRTRRFLVPLGDQAQFASTEAFEAIDGFSPWPILEDLDFIRRLKKRGRLAIVPLPATTSSRRFRDGGVVPTISRNWLIWILFACGVSPQRLARLYRRIR